MARYLFIGSFGSEGAKGMLASSGTARRAQIAAMVAEGRLDIVIFFRDPLDKHPHEPDVQMLMRLCDVYNVPLATNPATAELVLMGSTLTDA